MARVYIFAVGPLLVMKPISFWRVTSRTRGLMPQASATFLMIVDALSPVAPLYVRGQNPSAARVEVFWT
jgi:hypothetical protein